MPGGRPTLYDEVVQERAEWYKEHWAELNHAIPSIAGLAKYLGTNRDNCYEWAKKHDAFSDILRDIISDQEFELLNGSLKNKLNPQISKLVLGKHGYHDKVDNDNKNENKTTIVVASGKDKEALEDDYS